jgi:replication factor A1
LQEGDDSYVLKLKEATWVPHLFRVSVTQDEYMNEKRQRITVRGEAPVDFAAESKYLLEEIVKLTACKKTQSLAVFLLSSSNLITVLCCSR